MVDRLRAGGGLAAQESRLGLASACFIRGGGFRVARRHGPPRSSLAVRVVHSPSGHDPTILMTPSAVLPRKSSVLPSSRMLIRPRVRSSPLVTPSRVNTFGARPIRDQVSSASSMLGTATLHHEQPHCAARLTSPGDSRRPGPPAASKTSPRDTTTDVAVTTLGKKQ